MTAVLSGEADIGFMGSESSIYTYNEGATDYVVNFAQLTQRAGNFLVSRDPIENFQWESLKGSTVLGGRKGGMPQMVFEYILKQHGLDPASDLSINQNIDFGSTAVLLRRERLIIPSNLSQAPPRSNPREKDMSSLLSEKTAVMSHTLLTVQNRVLSGTFLMSFQSFTNALQKGMDFVQTHTPGEIAEVNRISVS